MGCGTLMLVMQLCSLDDVVCVLFGFFAQPSMKVQSTQLRCHAQLCQLHEQHPALDHEKLQCVIMMMAH